MNYGVVVEYEDTTDLMPWGPGTLQQALEMRDVYVHRLGTENLAGAKRVYVIFGERVIV